MQISYSIPRVLLLVLPLLLVFLLPSFTHAATCSFTRDLEQGDVGEDVRCLQRYLNASGYTISETGAGSPGEETTEFKSLTKKALMEWQVANTLTPATGVFGPKSRALYKTLESGVQTVDALPSAPVTTTSATVSNNSAELTAKVALLNAITRVQKLSQSGKNVSAAYENLFNAVKSYFTGAYVTAEKIAHGTAQGVATSKTVVSSSGDVDAMLEAAEEAIDEAKEAVNDADDDGEDIDEAEDLLDEARDLYDDAVEAQDDDEDTRALKLAKQAKSLALSVEDAIGDSRDSDDLEDRLEDLRDELDDARDEVEEADDDGEDVGDAEDLLDEAEDALDEAEDALDDDDEDEAEDQLDDAEDLIEEALDEM
jgi:peptidoglycan hydrolase-like protein with peptidoglycan-binding domain